MVNSNDLGKAVEVREVKKVEGLRNIASEVLSHLNCLVEFAHNIEEISVGISAEEHAPLTPPTVVPMPIQDPVSLTEYLINIRANVYALDNVLCRIKNQL